MRFSSSSLVPSSILNRRPPPPPRSSQEQVDDEEVQDRKKKMLYVDKYEVILDSSARRLTSGDNAWVLEEQQGGYDEQQEYNHDYSSGAEDKDEDKDQDESTSSKCRVRTNHRIFVRTAPTRNTDSCVGGSTTSKHTNPNCSPPVSFSSSSSSTTRNILFAPTAPLVTRNHRNYKNYEDEREQEQGRIETAEQDDHPHDSAGGGGGGEEEEEQEEQDQCNVEMVFVDDEEDAYLSYEYNDEEEDDDEREHDDKASSLARPHARTTSIAARGRTVTSTSTTNTSTSSSTRRDGDEFSLYNQIEQVMNETRNLSSSARINNITGKYQGEERIERKQRVKILEEEMISRSIGPLTPSRLLFQQQTNTREVNNSAAAPPEQSLKRMLGMTRRGREKEAYNVGNVDKLLNQHQQEEDGIVPSSSTSLTITTSPTKTKKCFINLSIARTNTSTTLAADEQQEEVSNRAVAPNDTPATQNGEKQTDSTRQIETTRRSSVRSSSSSPSRRRRSDSIDRLYLLGKEKIRSSLPINSREIEKMNKEKLHRLASSPMRARPERLDRLYSLGKEKIRATLPALSAKERQEIVMSAESKRLHMLAMSALKKEAGKMRHQDEKMTRIDRLYEMGKDKIRSSLQGESQPLSKAIGDNRVQQEVRQQKLNVERLHRLASSPIRRRRSDSLDRLYTMGKEKLRSSLPLTPSQRKEQDKQARDKLHRLATMHERNNKSSRGRSRDTSADRLYEIGKERLRLESMVEICTRRNRRFTTFREW